MAVNADLDGILHYIIFTWEGGGRLHKHPSDPGGLTKYGISQRRYPNEDITNLTWPRAVYLYGRDYWNKTRCDLWHPAIATVVFDSAINQGVSFATKTLQAAAGAKPDGKIGPNTIAAIYSMNKQDLISEFCALRAVRYGNLSTFHIFGKGWSRRLHAMQMHAVTKYLLHL